VTTTGYPATTAEGVPNGGVSFWYRESACPRSGLRCRETPPPTYASSAVD
jgi:hypothetical protein